MGYADYWASDIDYYYAHGYDLGERPCPSEECDCPDCTERFHHEEPEGDERAAA